MGNWGTRAEQSFLQGRNSVDKDADDEEDDEDDACSLDCDLEADVLEAWQILKLYTEVVSRSCNQLSDGIDPQFSNQTVFFINLCSNSSQRFGSASSIGFNGCFPHHRLPSE